MNLITMYIPAPTAALEHAQQILNARGIHFTADAADADYLLYGAPTKPETMADFTTGQTVIGGNLDFLSDSVQRIDLLKDPYYLSANAAITAEAALGMILQQLKCSIPKAKILILGWGRIGKCLTHQLHHLNAEVSVYARRQEAQAMLRALGYHPIEPAQLRKRLRQFHCIVNTAPAPILSAEDMVQLRPGCFKLELSSGLFLPGEGTVHARGLPGKCKPEASGVLIADTVLRHLGGG